VSLKGSPPNSAFQRTFKAEKENVLLARVSGFFMGFLMSYVRRNLHVSGTRSIPGVSGTSPMTRRGTAFTATWRSLPPPQHLDIGCGFRAIRANEMR